MSHISGQFIYLGKRTDKCHLNTPKLQPERNTLIHTVFYSSKKEHSLKCSIYLPMTTTFSEDANFRLFSYLMLDMNACTYHTLMLSMVIVRQTSTLIASSSSLNRKFLLHVSNVLIMRLNDSQNQNPQATTKSNISNFR